MKTKEVFTTKNILLFLLGILFVSFALHRIINTDIFFHIRCGNDMLRSGMIITKNIYSYAAQHYEFSNHSWFAKVIFAIVYNVCGIYGINLLTFVVLALVFARIAVMLVRSKYFTFYYFTIVVGLILAAPRFQSRPQLFSLLLFSLYLQILMEYVSDRNRKLALTIVPLQYIWNNMHAYSIIGPFIVLCFALDSMARSFFRLQVRKRKIGLKDIFFKKDTLSLGSILLLQIVSYLVLYRFDLFIKMYMQLFSGYKRFCFYAIEEFLPIGFGPHLILLGVFVLLTIPFVVRFRKAGDYARCAIYVALLLLSLRVSRNIAYFVIAGLTFTGYEVQKTSKQWALLKHVRQIENKKGLVHGALIAVICILILSQLFLMNAQVTGFGVDDMKVPVKVGDFLEQNEIAGNGYNEFAIGSYLIFRNLPSKRVLIHNQVEAYPPSIFDTYMQAYVNKNTMTRLVNQYKINYAIIKLRERGKNLIEWFASSKKWNMVYFDGMYFIFVVNNEQNKALIEQYSTFERAQALDEERAGDTFSFMRERTLAETILANVTGTAEVGYTQFNKKNVIAYRKAWAYLGMSYFNAAEQELANALRAAPWDKDVVHTFYTLYGRTKQYDRLQMVQAEVLQKFPEDRSLQFSYALALINTGHYDESLEVLDRLEKEKYLAYAINKARGDVYLMQGAFSDAEGYYLQARAVGKRYNEINLILGKLYVLMGDLQKARKMTEDYLAVNKHDTDAMLILADIYRGLEMPEDAQAMYKKVLDHDLFNEKARAFLRKK